jgi:hypothetical protein
MLVLSPSVCVLSVDEYEVYHGSYCKTSSLRWSENLSYVMSEYKKGTVAMREIPFKHTQMS